MNGVAGLCVGGPNAGVLYAASGNTFRVEVTPPRLVTKPLPPGALAVQTETHVYYRHRIGSVGLWIHGSMTIDEAIREIASAYRREQIAIDEITARGGEAPEPGDPHPGDGTATNRD